MLPSIAEHAKNHGIKPNKRLGQNFLFDLSLCHKIAKQSGSLENKIIVEIGPGVAGLTRAILENNPQKLIAIEKDKKCLDLLSEIQSSYPQLEVINADALKISISDIAKQYGADKVQIISNLPYNVGTKLLVDWLHHDLDYIESITVMLQKEVVQRSLSQTGDKNYGRLSIWRELYTEGYKCFDVAPTAFHPPPKVQSSILKLTPHHKYNIRDEELQMLNKILLTAFSARRKLFSKSLAALTNQYREIMEELSLDQMIRPDRITPEQYLAIAKSIIEECK